VATADGELVSHQPSIRGVPARFSRVALTTLITSIIVISLFDACFTKPSRRD